MCQSIMFIWPATISFQHIQELRLALAGKNSAADIGAGILPTAQQLTDMLSAMRTPQIIELINIFPVKACSPTN